MSAALQDIWRVLDRRYDAHWTRTGHTRRRTSIIGPAAERTHLPATTWTARAAGSPESIGDDKVTQRQ